MNLRGVGVVMMGLGCACSGTVSGDPQGGTGGSNGGSISMGGASGNRSTGGVGGARSSGGFPATGGASGSGGSATGGVPAGQCTTNAECPQLGCYMCSSICVNGRCVTYVPTGAGGVIGTGGANTGGIAAGGGGSGGAGTGGAGGSGPATCPDHAPRLPQYPYTPERCTFGDNALSCPYPTPEVGAGCRTTYVCRCLSNHMGGADCNWMGNGSVCPDGGP